MLDVLESIKFKDNIMLISASSRISIIKTLISHDLKLLLSTFLITS
jgi:hypothetical protein